MRYDPAKHHRRSLRLGGYDYAQANAYFVTLTVQSRRCLFARAAGGTIVPNEAGRALEAIWHTLPEHFPTISLDAFILMPNHAHMLIILNPPHPVRAPLAGAPDAAPTPSHKNAVPNITNTLRDENDISVGHIEPMGGDASDGAPTRGAPTGGGGTGRVGAGTLEKTKTADSPTLGAVVGAFKSLSTRRYMAGVQNDGWPPFDGRLWQRNYYERIVRDEHNLNCVRAYTEQNPAKWLRDRNLYDV